jgi:hypothetical protein
VGVVDTGEGGVPVAGARDAGGVGVVGAAAGGGVGAAGGGAEVVVVGVVGVVADGSCAVTEGGTAAGCGVTVCVTGLGRVSNSGIATRGSA